MPRTASSSPCSTTQKGKVIYHHFGIEFHQQSTGLVRWEALYSPAVGDYQLPSGEEAFPDRLRGVHGPGMRLLRLWGAKWSRDRLHDDRCRRMLEGHGTHTVTGDIRLDIPNIAGHIMVNPWKRADNELLPRHADGMQPCWQNKQKLMGNFAIQRVG